MAEKYYEDMNFANYRITDKNEIYRNDDESPMTGEWRDYIFETVKNMNNPRSGEFYGAMHQISKQEYDKSMMELEEWNKKHNREKTGRQKFGIDPLRVRRSTDKAVMVELAIAGQDKPKDTWFPKFRVDLDEKGENVVAVDKYLQTQYGDVVMKQGEIKAAAVGKGGYTIAAEGADGKPVIIAEVTQNDYAEQPAPVFKEDVDGYRGKSGKEIADMIKAKRLSDLEKNVPAEMKALPNWAVLKTWYDKATGTTKKFIINANDTEGKWAKQNDPNTWTTFDKALEYAKANGGAGLSFAIHGSGLNCFDLDHCYDKTTRTFDAAAQKMLADLPDAYAEKSVSGTGLHVFTKSQICESGKYREPRGEKEPIEVFETWGFVSMTGNIVDAKHKNLTQLPEAVQTEIQNQIGEKPQKTYAAAAPNRSFGNASDQEIIAKIEKSKKGDEFISMMNGADLCRDRNKTDFKMMNILAYFTNSNQAQMERIFQSSKLWDSERAAKKSGQYVSLTAKNAIESLCKQKDR